MKWILAVLIMAVAGCAVEIQPEPPHRHYPVYPPCPPIYRPCPPPYRPGWPVPHHPGHPHWGVR